MSTGAWMRSNLTTQGYCLSDAERRELSLALRFSTGLCLTLVVVAFALESPVMVFALPPSTANNPAPPTTTHTPPHTAPTAQTPPAPTLLRPSLLAGRTPGAWGAPR
jgi:hypothetical protein